MHAIIPLFTSSSAASPRPGSAFWVRNVVTSHGWDGILESLDRGMIGIGMRFIIPYLVNTTCLLNTFSLLPELHASTGMLTDQEQVSAGSDGMCWRRGLGIGS